VSRINARQIRGGVGSGGGGTSSGPNEIVAFNYLSSSPIILQTVTEGRLVYQAIIVISVPFDDPSAYLLFGITADPDLIFARSDVTVTEINQYVNDNATVIPSNDFLILTLVPGNSTQGAGKIYCWTV
jgi:hypothetical protein